MSTTKIVAYTLTLNEERNVGGVIESLRRVSDRIIVVDSYSDDSTARVAREHGAIVWQHHFESWASQHNWALDRIALDFGPEWVLRLDADERLSDSLVDQVQAIVSGDWTNVRWRGPSGAAIMGAGHG